jgi:cobalt/nickel transport system permease protein
VSSLHDGIYELGRLDTFALQDTAVHRIDTRAKVVATLVFQVCVVSFPKYTVVPLLPFVLFPVVMAGEGRLPFSWLGSRLLAAAPFAVVVGMFNPFIDRQVVSILGGPGIAAGWISFASIILRFMLTTAAALTLIGTTGMNGVCAALERLKVPDVFVTQLLFLYRYIFVLVEEGLRATRARDLRSFGRRGTGIRVFGQILGHLLLRTYARAQRIYSAMLLRGFDGHVRTRRPLTFTARDTVFMLSWSAAFVVFRYVNVPELLGNLITGVLS